MNIQLVFVDTRTRTAFSSCLNTAPEFGEESEPLTQMEICMRVNALQEVCGAGKAAGPVRIAVVFASLTNRDAEGEVIILVFTQRDVLQPVQEVGSAFRVSEITIVLIISHRRKARVWVGTPSFRLLLGFGLRPDGDTRNKDKENR